MKSNDPACMSNRELIDELGTKPSPVLDEIARRLLLAPGPTITDVFTRCPQCRLVHLDIGEWEDRPHRKHLCAECGHLWIVEGVAGPTRGKLGHHGAPLNASEWLGVLKIHVVALQKRITGLTVTGEDRAMLAWACAVIKLRDPSEFADERENDAKAIAVMTRLGDLVR